LAALDQPWFCSGATGALSSGVGSSSESGCPEVPTSGIRPTLGSIEGSISGCTEDASGQNFHRIGSSTTRSTKPKGLIVKDIISGVALFGRRRKIAIASAFFKAIVVEIIDFSMFEITDRIVFVIIKNSIYIPIFLKKASRSFEKLIKYITYYLYIA
jgi:hypothetical protein